MVVKEIVTPATTWLFSQPFINVLLAAVIGYGIYSQAVLEPQRRREEQAETVNRWREVRQEERDFRQLEASAFRQSLASMGGELRGAAEVFDKAHLRNEILLRELLKLQREKMEAKPQ